MLTTEGKAQSICFSNCIKQQAVIASSAHISLDSCRDCELQFTTCPSRLVIDSSHNITVFVPCNESETAPANPDFEVIHSRSDTLVITLVRHEGKSRRLLLPSKLTTTFAASGAMTTKSS